MTSRRDARRVARALALGAFAFASLVSLVILLSEDRLGAVDWLLLLGGPPLLSALFYLVGLTHDPSAAD